jgi:hypothetical protein
MPQICNMGPKEDTLKNPTASAGFEPPKPLNEPLTNSSYPVVVRLLKISGKDEGRIGRGVV